MRIDELRSDVTGAGVRVACNLTWQRQRRKAATLWFDFDPAASGPVAVDGVPTTAWSNAVATAALPLAFMHGEEVLEVDAPVCARLAQGLEHFAQAMRRCFARPKRGAAHRRSRHHCAGAGGRPRHLPVGRSGLAGAALPRAVHGGSTSGAPLSRGLHIFGLNTYDFDGGEPVPQRVDSCRRYLERLQTLGHASDIENLRHPLRPEILDSISARKPEMAEHYAELVQPLAEAGRPDLADAVSAMLAETTTPARTPTLLERARTLLARANAGLSR